MKIRFKIDYRDDQAGLIPKGTIAEINRAEFDGVFVIINSYSTNSVLVNIPYDAIRFCCESVKQSSRGKPSTYPANLSDMFEELWIEKGRKGSKKGALAKFKSYCQGQDDEWCERFTRILCDDISGRQDELGLPEMHLTTYLNQQRWEK